MNWVRSVGGVAAGFAVVALILGFATPRIAAHFTVTEFESFSMAYLLANLACVAAAATLGGYVAALIGRRREITHGSALGLLLIGLALASMKQHGETRPGWFEATLAGCGPMAAMFGAVLRAATKGRPESPMAGREPA